MFAKTGPGAARPRDVPTGFVMPFSAPGRSAPPRDAFDSLLFPPGEGAPDGARVRILSAADGVRLRAAFWRPPDTARGTVCLFHGRIEFIEKYAETVGDLLGRGFAVATLDFRGQGGSQRLLRNPLKGHVADFAQYRLDAEALMRQLVFTDCPPPFFALGHSMSAPVLLTLAERQPQWFERMVLIAPLIGLRRNVNGRWAHALAAGLCGAGLSRAYVPGGVDRPMSLLPFEGNPVTSDPKRYERTAALIRHAPELGLGAPTIGWLHAAYQATTAIARRGRPEAFRVPTLIMTAGDDRIVDPLAGASFAARLRGGGHLMMRGARHEIMSERDDIRDLFWAAFDAFVPGSRALR